MQLGGSPRIPVFSFADAAARAACTSMQDGDLGYQEDTKVLYTYDGATWNDVLAGVTETWTKLDEQTKGSTGTFNFTGIPATYKELQIIGMMRSDRAAATSRIEFNFNADTGNNYDYKSAAGDGGTGLRAIYPNCAAANATANYFTFFTAYIKNDATTLKNMFGISTHQDVSLAESWSGQWLNTAAITSIQILESSGGTGFIAKSYAALYGRL